MRPHGCFDRSTSRRPRQPPGASPCARRITTMDPALVARGVAIGFGVAAAVGPISLLVLRRALQRGFAYGLASGLGVATADATYGGIAAFGLTVVTEALVGIQRPLAIVGGAFLIVLGARSILAPPATAAARETLTGNTIASAPALAAAYGSILAISHPHPIACFSV